MITFAVMQNAFGAIILCGGKSSRFGSDKGSYLFRNKKLICWSIDLLKKYSHDIIVVGPRIIDDKNILFIEDIYPQKGPMGGIHAGLKQASFQNNIILACDTPFINEKIINLLISNYNPKNDITFFQTANAKQHPLCGIYSKNCLSSLEKSIVHEELKLIRFISNLEHKIIKLDNPMLTPLFENINHLSDAKKFE